MKFELSRGGFFLPVISIIVMALFFLSACTSLKNTIYFKSLPNDTTISRVIIEQNKAKIVKGDQLKVTVTSFNNDLDMIFNSVDKTSSVVTAQSTDGLPNGQLVDEEGMLKLHFIGKIKAQGLTLLELKAKIEEALQLYMKDPIVDVKFANKKVTIIGSVTTPKVIFINEDHVPLIDILAQTGDLKDVAIANDIMIFRDSADTKLVKHVNLEDHSLFGSPWYYSKPNDIIYVKKDIDQTDREEKKRSLQLTLSLFVSFATLVVIILNNLIK